MEKVSEKQVIKKAIETAYTILINHKYKKISNETIDKIVNVLIPYKTHIDIKDVILDLLAYKDTKARVLIKSTTIRLEKLLKRRFT